jgi:hypothetical protein
MANAGTEADMLNRVDIGVQTDDSRPQSTGEITPEMVRQAM